jgi:hypothetical protein
MKIKYVDMTWNEGREPQPNQIEPTGAVGFPKV